MDSPTQPEAAAFPGLIDLASERLGGQAVLANDEFFAPKENLLKPGRGVFLPEEYTERGKWMDGWETRRRRTPGHDWCIIRLGVAGEILGVDIDTNHFLGNHPPYASIDASPFAGDPAPEALEAATARWSEILPRSPLKPGSQNLFATPGAGRCTHVRLNIYPDGGVARLRLFGRACPDWARVKPGSQVDLAAVENGGVVVAASDMFFGSKENLILPGRSTHMGDGWETKRRRGPGHDWTIVRLGTAGTIQRIEVDTRHFKGNAPGACSLDASGDGEHWRELLAKTPLQPHARHTFEDQVQAIGDVTHVRFNIFPDGGVGRLRLYGRPK